MVDASTRNARTDYDPDWFGSVGQQSKFAIAVIDPTTLIIQRANDAFALLTGIAPEPEKSLHLWDIFSDFDEITQEKLYRRHLLHLILRDIYDVDRGDWRFLDEPAIATLKSPPSPEARYIEFWLRSDRLKIERIDPQIDEFADVDLPNLLDREILSQEMWEERIEWSNYRISGHLLWEGLDITPQEQIQRAIALLIEQDSIFEADTFAAIGEPLRSLFRAENHLFLNIKQGQVELFVGSADRVRETQRYALEALQGSPFLRAAEVNRVWNVPDLAQDCPTELEQMLRDRGVGSLLLIPLIRDDLRGLDEMSSAVLGFVALASDRANHFDRLDAERATTLKPAFKSAFRQARGYQFTRIHSSVEWRFRQEAERRSLGLPSEQIVLSNVYPLYGISDIRGSALKRNQSIQNDLLEQFKFALAVVEAADREQEIPFLEQLKLDLEAYIDRLSREVKAEDEVSAIDYLKKHLEIYFEYFRQCGSAAIEAVEAYEDACSNEHGYVYQARDRYDRIIGELNANLRATWERSQARMQQILPHYCDLEVADGIDHVLYVGASIIPPDSPKQFSVFHLHSLRYEQLRAMCECARICLNLREEKNLPLDVAHLVLVQDSTVDIFHDEQTEKLFDVRGSRDTRYEIVKKRIDKARDSKDGTRITQPGMLTVVYSTNDEWTEYHQYLRYLVRDEWVNCKIESGTIEPLQGISGLKYARVNVLQHPKE
ncbi:GAF domain-containing protein [Lusitaniella coriacea]|uniref:GAF domain-containing protein n=1 Tax=Lusitaniella coriacea TaxID=1983105 RepID=UPI003CF5F047